MLCLYTYRDSKESSEWAHPGLPCLGHLEGLSAWEAPQSRCAVQRHRGHINCDIGKRPWTDKGRKGLSPILVPWRVKCVSEHFLEMQQVHPCVQLWKRQHDSVEIRSLYNKCVCTFTVMARIGSFIALQFCPGLVPSFLILLLLYPQHLHLPEHCAHISCAWTFL